jgi:hypothetical protein
LPVISAISCRFEAVIWGNSGHRSRLIHSNMGPVGDWGHLRLFYVNEKLFDFAQFVTKFPIRYGLPHSLWNLIMDILSFIYKNVNLN